MQQLFPLYKAVWKLKRVEFYNKKTFSIFRVNPHFTLELFLFILWSGCAFTRFAQNNNFYNIFLENWYSPNILKNSLDFFLAKSNKKISDKTWNLLFQILRSFCKYSARLSCHSKSYFLVRKIIRHERSEGAQRKDTRHNGIRQKGIFYNSLHKWHSA
jgi:hypothetical protein